jgi:shikimate dehydrogenase
MSRQLAVVGSPICHSKSPAIHNAAYSVLNLEYEYSKIQVEKNHLLQFVEKLDDEWLGLSVTAPLKSEAFKIARILDDAAQVTHVVNTLTRVNGVWNGYNTDVFGLKKSIERAGLGNKRTISVIGSGATAISAVLAVARLNPLAKLSIAARNKVSASEVVAFAKQQGIGQVRTVSVQKALTENELVISTLPANALDEQITKLRASWFKKPKGALYDVAYEPWPSVAAQLWVANGLQVVSGIEMLLWQAIAQIRIFSGGSQEIELPNEAAVFLAMRDSIGLI